MKLFFALLLISVIAIAGCSPAAPQERATESPDVPDSAMPVPDNEDVEEQAVIVGNGNAPDAGESIEGNVVASGSDDVVAGEVKEFAVAASQFTFDPETIRVKEGDTVRLVVTSTDVPHGLSIPEFGVNSGAIGAGETKTVEFVANKKGTYAFFCSVFCGSGHKSMKGTLVVE